MTRHRRNQLLFYVAFPTIIGFLLGTNQTGIGLAFPWVISVVFWVTVTLGAWLVFHLGTLLGAYLLRPWEPALVIKLGLGLLMASLPARWFINEYIQLFEPFMIGGRVTQPIPVPAFDLEFILLYVRTWLGIYVLWISTNIFFDKVLGFSRYRLQPTFEADSTPSGGAEAYNVQLDVRADEPRELGPAAPMKGDSTGHEEPSGIEDRSVSVLLSRLPRSLGLRIRALKSEDHYLRVYTDLGDTLILYKLSTAIEELETLGFTGLRVHRSWWVRRKAIEQIERDGRRWTVTLSTGLLVPVSQTYHEPLRREGLVT